MDHCMGAFPDGEWDYSRIFSVEDHQLHFTSESESLSHFSFLVDNNNNDGGLQLTTNLSGFCPNPEANMNMAEDVNESLFYSWNTLNSDFQPISQENSSSSNCSSRKNYYFHSDSNHIPVTNDISIPMDFCIMDQKNSGSFASMFPEIAMRESVCINAIDVPPGANAVPDEEELQFKRKFDVPESEVNPSDSCMKKKPRVTRDEQKRKKNVKSNKNQKLAAINNEEEDRNPGSEGQSSSSCSSEEDNASQDSNDDSKVTEALNSNGKTRAGRGSATDPQSLYARKRRERINQRLRILQNLVPNGTKVDISTMLEEAVHYVKFLQLQIKLLSSDDLWMYAPIAYNGIDIGLNQKISTLL